MRLVIDLQGAQSASRFRGIGRYTLSLAQALVRNCGSHEVSIALNGLFPETIEPLRGVFEGLLPQDRIKVWNAAGPVRGCDATNQWRREVAELTREAFIAEFMPDLVHIPSMVEGYIDDAVTSIGLYTFGIPTVVTLHDVIPLLNPEVYLSPNPSYAQFYLHKLEQLKKADAWLAVSSAAAVECGVALGLDKDRIFPIVSAADPVFCEDRGEIDDTVLSGIQLAGRPFILYSGGADERKNLPRLIRAYASLPVPLRYGYQLVFAGQMPDCTVQQLHNLAFQLGLQNEELMFTGYVSDQQLAGLYRSCQLFVFPSWHEGFGLPVLEAMSCGAAVICARGSSLTEVVGWEEALFDPFDETTIAAKLLQGLTDKRFREALKRHGRNRAGEFSWDTTAYRVWKAFETVLAERLPVTDRVVPEPLIDAIAGLKTVVKPTDRDLVATAWSIVQNHPCKQSKQLFVDISELVQRDARSGVQRVTRSILKELLDSPPADYQVVPVYATREEPGYRQAASFIARLTGADDVIEDTVIDPAPGDIFLGLDLQHHVVQAQQPYLDHLYHLGIPVWFVVYDLLPVLMPHTFPPGADSGHAAWLQVITRYTGALCISRTVADELDLWCRHHAAARTRPYRISWFHLGADVEGSLPSGGLPDDAPQVLSTLAARPSFLMVGTIEPRKGYVCALAAFEQLWAADVAVNLVIVGKQGWMVEELAQRLRSHPEQGKRLFWLEGVSDEYLAKLYEAGSCLIAASEGEGFGLPLIEAAQHGLPIIVRDIPVFREVGGAYADYFDGSSPSGLASAVSAWLSAGTARGGRELSWLTWAESAGQIRDRLGI
jgi:glycosyltransferase involved in cell wall biosynthesis